MNFKRILTASLLMGFIFLQLCCWTNASIDTKVKQGKLTIDGVYVTRINLAVKEIDVTIGLLDVSVNGSFTMAIWAPYRTRRENTEYGGTITITGKPVPDSPPWHQFQQGNLEWLRFLRIKTTGFSFLGMNGFPYEVYQSEVIIGFNVSNVKAEVRNYGVSYDLEQQGMWNASSRIENTTYPLQKLRGNEYYINENGIVKFLSLIITIQHPQGYQEKMLIPTWGPLALIIIVIIAQLILAKRLSKSDHVTILVAVAIFGLTTYYTVREVTPPELTLSEFFLFAVSIIYVILWALIIGVGWYQKESNTNIRPRSCHAVAGLPGPHIERSKESIYASGKDRHTHEFIPNPFFEIMR